MSTTISTQMNIQNKKPLQTGATKGYLVHENPIQSAKSTLKGYVKNGKYLIDGINGKGDDYSIGKINDFTTRLGSIGIAAALASLTKSPVAKTMEFAGFASFFAAMSIWPKLFISAPLKAKTGFDVNQQYVDSYGRRKRFFEDPQYLPWDLWKSEDINKVGDKLHIPKNIENRTSHTQDKMKQIATQSNTLWMLTAGFATPLMASLMGNYASKYVEKVTEASRVQSAIKQTGMSDFTRNNQNILEKIFVNPIAKLSAATKKTQDLAFMNQPSINDSDKFDEIFKNLDSAYDSIFGKSTDAAFEFNKAMSLYKDVPNDMRLTQYNEKLGMTVIKDSNGKTIKSIKTKNVDGISLFGDKWKSIPNKMSDILGISPKEYKKMTKNIISVGTNEATKHDSDEIAEILIKKFAGTENKASLEKAFKNLEKVLTPSIKELDNASESYKTVLDKAVNALKSIKPTDDKAKKILEDKIKLVGEAQQVRLENKVINTKVSWFSPVRILDIIAKHSDENMNDALTRSNLKEELSEFIHGVTKHHVNNNFDDIIKEGDIVTPEKYILGVQKYFAKLSDKTKTMLGESYLTQSIDKTTDSVAKKILKLINPADRGKNFENICEWLGKTPNTFLTDAAKQNGIYRGWLKKVGGGFAVLTAVTLAVMSQFGKTNKYNPEK